MDAKRFESLADAYGADIRRWPDADREAARAWQSREPEAARRILAQAEVLDAALDAWRPPPVPAALRDRVLAAAPRPRPRRNAIGFWLSGAGLAAACAAGVIVGVAGSSAALSDARADDVLAVTLPDETGAVLNPFNVSGDQGPARDA